MNNMKFSKPVRMRLRPQERRLILIIGDLAVAAFSLIIAIFFWAQPDWLNFSFTFIQERIPWWYYLLPLVWMLLLTELYDVRRASRQREVIRGIIIAAIVSSGLYLLVYFTSEPSSLPRRGVAAFILVNAVLTLLWRVLYIRIFTAHLFMRRVLIVGAGRSGETLANIVKDFSPPPFILAGFIDDDQDKIGTAIQGYRVLGSNKDLLSIAESENISDLIFSISRQMGPEMFQTLLKAEELGIEITTMPISYEELLGRVPIRLLQSDWIIRSFVDHAHMSSFYEAMKRLMDVIGSIIGIFFFVIILPIVSLSILIDSGWPIFYTQYRLGKNARLYKIIKFRTMYKDAEKDGSIRPAEENDERVTRIGKFLRRSRIDESPQFINIILGEMSLVGPRAERPELAERLQTKVPFYRARLLVKPGLSGWAQVNFGYASSVDDTTIKLEYDLYYIKHRNLVLDFTILFRTIGTVIGFRGT